MNRPENQDTVDFRAELIAISQEYGPRYHCEQSAITEAAELWGTHCNRHGVLDQITERIRVEHKGYAATIRLYRTAKDYWKIALDFSAPESGFCTPASVWTGTAFTSDLAARRLAIEQLLMRCTARAHGRGNNADLHAFRAKLETELTPQLALF